MDGSTFRFLLSPAGQTLLAEAAALRSTETTLLADLTFLRKRYPAEQAAAALEMVRLRGRAAAKFSRAEHMYFTSPALEQASGERIAAYRAKLSRALLDRFDLVVALPRARSNELAAPGEPSVVVAGRVAAAVDGLRSGSPSLAGEAERLLSRAVDRLPLSARGRARVARVAATVAALAGCDAIAPEHVAEALSYRVPDELGSAP